MLRYVSAVLATAMLFCLANSQLEAAVTATSSNATSDTAFDGAVSATDLANSGQPTFSSVTTSKGATFGFGGINNGAGGTNTTDSTFYTSGNLPTMVTFNLNTTTNADGYDIQSIQSIAGWSGGGNSTQANQIVELLTSRVGSTSYISHGTFNTMPFVTGGTGPTSSQLLLNDTSGVIASNVDSVRLNLVYPGITGTGSNNGTVYRELDVNGLASTTAAPVNLIQNGSFELPALGTGVSSTAIAAIPNWTINGEVTLVNQTFGTVASDGNQWLSLESNSSGFPNNFGSVSQTFATDVGATYELSFNYNALGNNTVTTDWELLYDIGDGDQSLFIPNPNQLELGSWLSETVLFVADSPLTTVEFTGVPKVNGFFGAAIDGVSVVQVAAAPVPEPSSLLLWVVVAVIGLLIGRRQFRR